MLGFFFSFKSPVAAAVPAARPGRDRRCYVWLERRRARHAPRSWSSPALLPNMVVGRARAPGGTSRRSSSRSRSCCSSSASPGPQAKFTEAKDGATVVLMVDVSGSMGGERRQADAPARGRRGDHELREEAARRRTASR